MRPGELSASARRWLYVASWIPYVAAYQAALVANAVRPWPAFENAALTALPDVLLGPLVLRGARRLPRAADLRPRHFVLLIAALAAFVTAATLGWFLCVAAFDGLTRGNLRDLPELRLVPWRMINDALIFVALVAVAAVGRAAEEQREQAARVARAEALRARAELEAMRHQLQPHFVFNTYHALVGLVRRDPEAAEEALERLGDLLRFSLRVQRDAVDEVPLGEECAFVENYLRLEHLRLGDRLRFALEIAPATASLLVPSFAVQTLVENAVRHAIAPRTEGGTVRVTSRREAECLIVDVDDDGRGEAVREATGHGLGLRILQERLDALYAGAAGLALGPGPVGGTRARLTFARPREVAA